MIELRDDKLDLFRTDLPADDVSPLRLAFAATHVVMRDAYRDLDHSTDNPGSAEEIAEFVDWKATMRLRTRLDGLGFGIAEAMDTAQRFELGWLGAERLIRDCGALELQHGFIAGAGVDHLTTVASKDDLVRGVVEQVAIIQSNGGFAILLPMQWLASTGCSPDDYVEVYARIINACEGPLCVHWLGEMFMPALKDYFPGDSFERIMRHDREKVRGCKLSLLDAEFEVKTRALLARNNQVVFTGDDFNFSALIGGKGEVERSVSFGSHDLSMGAFSHALLGVFDGIAVPASLALQWLAHGDLERYHAIMDPCEDLGRWIFSAPTQYYKAGLAFLSWLNGHQDQFMLVNRAERARSYADYLRTAELASACGAIEDATLAAERLRELKSHLAE